MDEPTTTPVAPDLDDAILPDEEGAQSQPEAPTEAATEPNEQQPNTAEAQEEPSTDENLEWLKNKGIDPSSPEALAKIAEMARNAEKKMHESTAKASQLQKSLTDTQPAPGNSDVEMLAADVQRLKMENSVNAFFASNPEAKALEQNMAQLVIDRPELGQLVNAGYMTVDDLYKLASTGTEVQTAKKQGGKEALEQLAKKQQAKAVPGSATSSEMSKPDAEDPFLKAFEAN